MPVYANLGGNSSVASYDDSPPDAIIVTFKSGRWLNYEYTNQSAGPAVVARMKQFAARGQGLGSYIQRAAKYSYARKW